MASGRRIFRKWKELLFGARSHELLVFCFFLAVSFGFWLLQALNETLEREVEVALELENVPDDVVIIDSLTPSVHVVLRDRGLILARHSIYSLFKPNSLEIDFGRYDTGQEDAEVHVPASDIQRMAGSIFSVTTKIQSFRPETIRFAYNRGQSKMLPVKLAGTFMPSRQNYIREVRIEPDSVRVFAPKVILDTMQAVCSEEFLQEGLQEDKTFLLGLHSQRLTKYEPGQVRVRVSTGYYTEKTVKVPVIGLNFPAGKKLRTFPAQVAVTFSVESGRYHQTVPEDFVLATTYEELLSDSPDSRLQPRLKTVPEGVRDVRIEPQEVDYLIEQVAQED